MLFDEQSNCQFTRAIAATVTLNRAVQADPSLSPVSFPAIGLCTCLKNLQIGSASDASPAFDLGRRSPMGRKVRPERRSDASNLQVLQTCAKPDSRERDGGKRRVSL